MRKFLTTGLFGAILGLLVGAPADASLISRGFLDEALTDYATTTALDLKADKADLTDLSDKIGTLPEGITLENFYKGWVDSGGESMAKYIATQGGKGVVFTYDPVNDDVKQERFPDVGYLDVLARLMDQEGFTPAENSVLAPFFYLTKQAMRVGEIPRDKTAAGMIDEINTAIGTLPSGSLLGNSPAMDDLFKFTQGADTPVFPNSLSDLINQLYGGKEGRPGAISALLLGFEHNFSDEYSGPVGVLPAMQLGISANTAANTALATATEAKTAADATTAALDLKANQSDLTNLSNIVGTPAELTYRDIMRSGIIADLMGMAYYDTYGDNTVPTNNISELINLNYTDIDFPGLAGVVESLFWPRDRDDSWQIRLYDIFDDYNYLSTMGRSSFTDLIIDGGTLTRPSITVYGLKDLTTKVDANTAKIGTLPTTMGQIALPETVGEQLDYIFNHKDPIYNETAIFSLSKISNLLSLIINGTYNGDKGMLLDYGEWYKFRNLQVLTSDIDTINTNIGTVPDGKNLVGMISETDAKIGTLPSGNFPGFPESEYLFSVCRQPHTYPTSLAELITAIYGNSETGAQGLLSAIITGFPIDRDGDGSPDEHVGIKPNYMRARDANVLATANTGKIGTVPYGKNLAGMISETDAKIGTLPTEYATVGAALTAMDAKIDARELPSTSDDGQYVLSAKKVGDTITYTWVKMDLTSEEQAQ